MQTITVFKMKTKAREIKLEKDYKELINYFSRFDFDFFVFLISATIVCFLGFAMDNVPIIIGAMVLSPLLYPIIAIPLTLLKKDWGNFIRSLLLLLSGFILTILLVFFLGKTFFIDLENLNVIKGLDSSFLFFFLIAFFSGLAGNFCYFWPKASSAMTGVAISIALLPPLVILGLSLSYSSSIIFENISKVILLNTLGILLGSAIVSLVLVLLKKTNFIKN